MKFWLGVAATLIVLVAGGLAITWGGVYNIAATDAHFDPVRWALAATMKNSVERRADQAPPGSFTEENVRKGFASFDSTCVECHGAPGVEKAEWAKGLRPSPPDLSEHAQHWTSPELFWIVKNGVKMSGMPAMGPTHDDSQIWPIVAFLERLPEIDAATYAEMRENVSAGHHDGGGGEHGSADGGSGAQSGEDDSH